MTRTQYVCYLIAISQLVLGVLYLFFPVGFVTWQGLAVPAPDAGYPMAMFAARLLVYGAGMVVIGNNPGKYRLWLDGMIAIQLIDLAAGIFYVTSSIVAFENAALAMINATVFIGLMLWVRRAPVAKALHPA